VDVTDEKEARLQEVRNNIEAFAKAKADRVYLEHFRKSKRSILMKRAMAQGHAAVSAQEREAESDPEYIELLEGLREATETEAHAYWNLKVAEMQFEAWRSRMASARVEMGRYG